MPTKGEPTIFVSCICLILRATGGACPQRATWFVSSHVDLPRINEIGISPTFSYCAVILIFLHQTLPFHSILIPVSFFRRATPSPVDNKSGAYAGCAWLMRHGESVDTASNTYMGQIMITIQTAITDSWSGSHRARQQAWRRPCRRGRKRAKTKKGRAILRNTPCTQYEVHTQ